MKYFTQMIHSINPSAAQPAESLCCIFPCITMASRANGPRLFRRCRLLAQRERKQTEAIKPDECIFITKIEQFKAYPRPC